MPADRFRPRQGGVKVVVDVPNSEVERALAVIAADGFEARRYYPAGSKPRTGGPVAGWTRLGAERPRRSFTATEQAAVLAAFEGVLAAHRLRATVVGVDAWSSGGGADGPAGVREPRRPGPRPVVAAGALDLAQPLDTDT